VFNRFCTVACGPVAEHTITVDFDDGAQRIFRRIITQPIRSWKAQPPAPPTPTTNRPRAHERSGHRSDGAVCGSAPSASRVLRIADATACGGPGPWSLYQPCGRINHGQATACPTTRRPSSPRTRTTVNHNPHTFPSPNVKHHPGLKRQASGETRQNLERRRDRPCRDWPVVVCVVESRRGVGSVCCRGFFAHAVWTWHLR
jgi:hypothetical protein